MLVLTDRVKESSKSEGQLNYIDLNDTYGSFQSFASGIRDGNSTYYTIENNTDFEVGIGTYDFANNRLHRDVVLESSNDGSKINLLGVSTVFCTYPAEHSFFLNESGYASGQLPHYSGIAFPDGSIQKHAITGSGSPKLVTLWDDKRNLTADHNFGFDTATNTLSVSGLADFYSDVSISGNLTIAGDQTIVDTNVINSTFEQTTLKDTIFYRTSAGSFFHAYVDNATDNMISLYSTNESCMTWKLGFKRFSPSFVGPPDKSYVFGDCDSVGGEINPNNYYVMHDANGFWVHHGAADIFNVSIGFGTTVHNSASTTTALNIKGAAGQAVNLTEWKNYSGSVLASVNKDGQFSIPSVKFPDGSIQTTAYSSSYRNINEDASLSILDDVVFLDPSSQSFTVFLPSAVGTGGKKLYLKRKIGTYNVIVRAQTNETIDGQNTRNMVYDHEALTFVSDNTNWYII